MEQKIQANLTESSPKNESQGSFPQLGLGELNNFEYQFKGLSIQKKLKASCEYIEVLEGFLRNASQEKADENFQKIQTIKKLSGTFGLLKMFYLAILDRTPPNEEEPLGEKFGKTLEICKGR